MTSNRSLIEQLKEEISDKSVTVIPLKTGGGSYGIKYLGKHRIARVQEMKKGGYKCTCDDEKSRRIFIPEPSAARWTVPGRRIPGSATGSGPR